MSRPKYAKMHRINRQQGKARQPRAHMINIKTLSNLTPFLKKKKKKKYSRTKMKAGPYWLQEGPCRRGIAEALPIRATTYWICTSWSSLSNKKEESARPQSTASSSRNRDRKGGVGDRELRDLARRTTRGPRGLS